MIMNLVCSALLLGTVDLPTATAPAGGWDPALTAALTNFAINIGYAIAAVMFVFGLKMMSSPKTARRGNFIGALGMLLAIAITLANQGIVGYTTLIAGAVVGGLIGAIAAQRVPMTQMPEFVALFNGSGGIASAIVAAAEYWKDGDPAALAPDTSFTIALSVFIGLITLFGSLVAYGKLSGMKIRGVRLGNPITFPGRHVVNLGLLGVVVILCGILAPNSGAQWALILLILISSALGVLLVFAAMHSLKASPYQRLPAVGLAASAVMAFGGGAGALCGRIWSGVAFALACIVGIALALIGLILVIVLFVVAANAPSTSTIPSTRF